VQGLSKFAQGQQTFICNIVFVFKLCEIDILTMYYEIGLRFFLQQFNCFQDLVEHVHA
jgi:hypothetical protein